MSRQIPNSKLKIFDDGGHKMAAESKSSSGALYALYSPRGKTLKPVGEWNTARIIVDGTRIEHWLNGRRLLTARVGGCRWRQQKANSKFSDVSGFGEVGPGRIMLTDHNSEVWYRNVFIGRR